MLKLHRAQVIIFLGHFLISSWFICAKLWIWFCVLVTVLNPHPLKGRELHLTVRAPRPHGPALAPNWWESFSIPETSLNVTWSLCFLCVQTCMCQSVFQINNCSLLSNLISLSLSKCSAPSCCQFISPLPDCVHFHKTLIKAVGEFGLQARLWQPHFSAKSDFGFQIRGYVFSSSPGSCWAPFSRTKKPRAFL